MNFFTEVIWQRLKCNLDHGIVQRVKISEYSHNNHTAIKSITKKVILGQSLRYTLHYLFIACLHHLHTQTKFSKIYG